MAYDAFVLSCQASASSQEGEEGQSHKIILPDPLLGLTPFSFPPLHTLPNFMSFFVFLEPTKSN